MVPCVLERETAVLSTEWIESAGGPLVVIPRSVIAEWKGTPADYEEACGVADYLGLLCREWGDVLVLGDEPLRTAVVARPEGPVIVRWMFAPSAEQLVDVALNAKLDELSAVETHCVGLCDEVYSVFDSGADGSGAVTVEFIPPRGVSLVRTYVVRDDVKEVGMILHCFWR
ncbi:immunity 21 family protein [Myxococcus sp. K38C18041901]|uniref:Imm21 family immunity protein n=1 Tax=Myxococcus guangdongensis TaxID=2906760 RepID=UPI0020A72BA1|nr:Imm21 family immunity protein [Myxococcus guangdongensis]MCP3058796.1 immunity 21 family protein [Myxococcus guangdongensis]